MRNEDQNRTWWIFSLQTTVRVYTASTASLRAMRLCFTCPPSFPTLQTTGKTHLRTHTDLCLHTSLHLVLVAISAAPESDNTILRSDISSSALTIMSPQLSLPLWKSLDLLRFHPQLYTQSLRHKPLQCTECPPYPQCGSRHYNLSSFIRHESSGADF